MLDKLNKICQSVYKQIDSSLVDYQPGDWDKQIKQKVDQFIDQDLNSYNFSKYIKLIKKVGRKNQFIIKNIKSNITFKHYFDHGDDKQVIKDWFIKTITNNYNQIN